MKTQITLTGKVKPIAMQPPLVGQTLAGIKTNTCRLMNPQPEEQVERMYYDSADKEWFGVIPAKGDISGSYKPRYQPGDLLYITEQHFVNGLTDCDNYNALVHYEDSVKWHQISWNTYKKVKPYKSRPARFMFKDFTRCVVLVEYVRPDRLQDISEEDAIAEGIHESNDFKTLGTFYCNYGAEDIGTALHPIESFRTLWNSIHAAPGTRWKDNPWVWRIQYRKVWEGHSWYLHEAEVIESLKLQLQNV
jgi:hypothetical protein